MHKQTYRKVRKTHSRSKSHARKSLKTRKVRQGGYWVHR